MKTFSRILAMLLICQNAHGQSTSIPNNTLILGKTGATNKIIEFNLTKGGATTNPRFRWNNGSSFFDLSNDGTTFSRVSRYSDKLSVFAATSSSELASILSDETGSGSSVFGTSPTITTPSITSPTIDGNLLLAQEIDSSSTGANVALTVSKPTIILTNVSLTSIGSINSPSTGKTFVILNKTTGSVTVKNEYVSATATNRIITGTGSDLTLSADASLFVQYNNNNSRWHIVGGSGAGGLSAKGQTDSLYSTFTNIEVPHNQLTTTAANIGLIETGNGNIVPDPSFESLTSGWTASGGATAAANSTAKGTGAKGYDWDSNAAAQTLTSTSITIPDGLAGRNGIAYCDIKTVSGTATHTFTVNNGTTDIETPITIQSSTTSFAGQNEGNKINFVFPTSGTIRIKLASVNANEPEIYIDDCSIKLADNVYDAPLVTAWKAYTPTFTGFGTVTNVECQSRRVGENEEVRCKATFGTVTATEARISLPNSLVSADTTKIPSIQIIGEGVVNSNGGVGDGVGTTYAVLAEPSVSYVTFGTRLTGVKPLDKLTGSGGFTSSTSHNFKWSIPIQGYTAVSAVSADQTDYDWTSYTPTFTGFGTVTNPECQHSRVASNLMVQCKFTVGTATAVEARVSLPNSLTSASTTKIPSIQMAGTMVRSTSLGAFATHYALIEPSTSYFTFSSWSGSYGALTKALGNIFSDTLYFTATIPIQGWSSNQRASTLVGSVTSNSTNALKQTSIRHTTSCTTGTCASASADGITSCAFSSTGVYNCTVTAAYSSTPDCLFSTVAESGNVSLCRQDYTNSTPSNIRVNCFTTGSTTAVNTAWYMQCQGPR